MQPRHSKHHQFPSTIRPRRVRVIVSPRRARSPVSARPRSVAVRARERHESPSIISDQPTHAKAANAQNDHPSASSSFTLHTHAKTAKHQQTGPAELRRKRRSRPEHALTPRRNDRPLTSCRIWIAPRPATPAVLPATRHRTSNDAVHPIRTPGHARTSRHAGHVDTLTPSTSRYRTSRCSPTRTRSRRRPHSEHVARTRPGRSSVVDSHRCRAGATQGIAS